MTDYTRSTGGTGTMMIRDVGNGWVEYWLKAGSQTFAHQMPWAYVINGTTSGWLTYDFPTGGNWQHLGSWYVTSSQTVTFKLGSTGTGGLGGPTDFSQYIARGAPPPPPPTPQVPDPPNLSGPYNVGSSTADLSISNNWDGGAAIGDHQIGYGQDPWTVQYLSALSGTNTWVSIGGLGSGATYYFWARAWNNVGWSNWGNRVQATTQRVPDATSTPWIDNVLATSVRASFYPNGDGGSPINWYEVGYGTDPNSPMYGAYGGSAPLAIGGLAPGTTYYFWSRAQNGVGWGPWSGRSSVRTIAGAFILAAGSWHLAVPYIKAAGSWRLAEPWINTAGGWRITD